jgi:hypothetical protein
MVAAKTTETREKLISGTMAMLGRARETHAEILTSIKDHSEMLTDRVVPLGQGGKARFVDDPEHQRIRMIIDEREEAQGFTYGDQAWDFEGGQTPGESTTLSLHRHAATQVGEKLGVPGIYVRELQRSPDQWARKLIAHNLNEWATNGPRERVLVRSIGDQARGILSDRFRRLDTGTIGRAYWQAAVNGGARLHDATYTDTRIRVRMLLPIPFDIPLGDSGRVDTVMMGSTLENSDFGDGALSLSLYMFRLWCANGQVGSSLLRQIHLGGRLPDNIALSESTYQADTATQAGVVADAVKASFSEETVAEWMAGNTKAAATRVDDAMVQTLPRLGLHKAEFETVEKLLRDNDSTQVPEGPLTAYKVSQAVAAVGRDAEPRRRMDLERLAAKFSTQAVKSTGA